MPKAKNGNLASFKLGCVFGVCLCVCLLSSAEVIGLYEGVAHFRSGLGLSGVNCHPPKFGVQRPPVVFTT